MDDAFSGTRSHETGARAPICTHGAEINASHSDYAAPHFDTRLMWVQNPRGGPIASQVTPIHRVAPVQEHCPFPQVAVLRFDVRKLLVRKAPPALSSF